MVFEKNAYDVCSAVVLSREWYHWTKIRFCSYHIVSFLYYFNNIIVAKFFKWRVNIDLFIYLWILNSNNLILPLLSSKDIIYICSSLHSYYIKTTFMFFRTDYSILRRDGVLFIPYSRSDSHRQFAKIHKAFISPLTELTIFHTLQYFGPILLRQMLQSV